MITIGIDPHKSSLTAVAVDPSGQVTGHRRLLVNAGTAQPAARPGPPAGRSRRFAVEGAYGLGRPSPSSWPPPASTSLDVPATLAARARLLATGGGRKTDAADAASVAQVALHRRGCALVAAEDQTTILRLLAERRDDLAANAPASSTACTACCATCSPAAPPPT